MFFGGERLFQVLFCFRFVWGLFETGSQSTAQAVLKLTMYIILALNLQQSCCLSPQVLGLQV